ncbi:MAG: adenylyltransferase/cytidyltransferase family protein, partial [bacterium]|nr:adenylyltransferase/cytidyltransferase family protein [bacterium]
MSILWPFAFCPSGAYSALGQLFKSYQGGDHMFRKEGIFGYGTNLEDRLIPGFPELSKLMEMLRYLKYRVVLTQGKFNQKHYGHERYVEKARALGDFLIVGVDSDEKVRAKRGPDYPLIPQAERIEGLAHTRHVDALFIKEKDYE